MDVFEVLIKHQLLAVAGATQVTAPHVRVVESNVFIHARSIVRFETAPVRADVATGLQREDIR